MLLMGKSTISMAIFNSYVSLPEGKTNPQWKLPINEHRALPLTVRTSQCGHTV